MINLLPITPLIFCLQMIFTHTSALDITLSLPRTTIKAQIGEELKFTCEAFKCQDPRFTWASVIDKTLSGTIRTVGQRSTLTMRVNSESDGSYRCTVSCNTAPGEKSFTLVVYSFPSDPILHISSLVAGEQSRITCTLPNIYPSEMVNAQMLLDTELVAEYDGAEMGVIGQGLNNISFFYDLTLTEKFEAKEIKCVAKMAFMDEPDEMQKDTAMVINLMYPPGKPQIVVLPSTAVAVGEEITLTCSSQDNVQWVKLVNGEELEVSSDAQGKVILSYVELGDSGVYICYAKNNVGKTSSQVEITVQGLPEKPMMTIQPGTTVIAGQAVTIECLANGHMNTNVTLWKVPEDGDALFLHTEGKVFIKEADPIDTAEYRCTAENEYGISETSESLTVKYPPMDTVFSSSAMVLNEGDTVTLSCVSKGFPKPSISLYQLLTSGESVLLSGGPVITLTNVTSGVYQCQASNLLGSEKDELEVRVRVPPKNTYVTITPSPVVREGDNVHIRCTSEASPDPSLVLKMRKKQHLFELEAENGQYSIPHVSVELAGTYICESSNVVGQQIAEAMLTVQAPPKETNITITPSPVVREGDNVHIRCSSKAVHAPKLVLKVKTEHGLTELDSESGQYNISHAGMEHMGTYICESTNVVGQQIAETTLTVQAPPKNTYITIFPTPVVKEGDSVQITCMSEASPAPRLFLKIKTEHGLFDLESEDGTYNISHAGMEHIGTYICESTNVVGQQIAETTLTVQVAPKNTYITIIPTPVVKEGDSVQIICISEASPASRLVLKIRTEHGLIELESEDGTYNISHAGMEHIGTYICESTNLVGQQMAENTLTVQIPLRNTTVVVTPSQNIREGDTVTITCETHNIPSPTITLQKACARNSTVLHTSNGTFTLHNVTCNDTGTYTINIISSAGNETEVINIFVAERLESSRFNPIPTVIIGSAAFVSAGVIGMVIYYLKQARGKGSYSLVNAFRSKV